MTSRAGRAARSWPALAMAALVVLLLPGCAQIPTSGPVVNGEEVGDVRDDQFVRVIARPPVPGMTSDQVVRGFLEASASFQDDYAVARSYLTAAAAASWNPDEGVRVYDSGASTLTPASETTAVLAAPLVGTISTQGEYLVAAPGATLREPIGLGRVDGEWRITVPPPGLLLSRGDVERGYRTFNVYFLDPSYTTLVPDPITVRVSGAGLATTLARALLRGATPWLAPAVRTAFPDGTSLAIDSVPVEGGVAQVALDPRVLVADDRTREALCAQLVWTLSALPDVTGVRITVAGQPLQVPGQGPVQPRTAWPQYDPDALPAAAVGYVVDDGKVLRLGADRPVPVPGAAGTGTVPLQSIAVSLDSSEVAGLSADRRRLLAAKLTVAAPLAVRATGTELLTPGYGRDGSLWWVDGGAGVRRQVAGAAPTEVRVAGLDGGDVVGVRLARDGTRAALLVRQGSRRSVYLARVVTSGTTVTLAAPRRVEARIADAVDVAWGTASRLVVLGSDGAGPDQAFLVDIGQGTTRPIGAPAAPRSVAAAPGRLVLIGGDGNRVWEYQSGRWIAGVDGSSPTYPG